MEQNYTNVDEILENPGILIFTLNNPNKIFPDKKFQINIIFRKLIILKKI